MLSAALAANVPLPSLNVYRDRLLTAMANGEGDLDWSVMARVQARASGGMALTVVMGFVASGLLLVPATALIVVTALIFGPRLGFAYSPSTRWTVRGGAGLFYGPREQNQSATVDESILRTEVTMNQRKLVM